MRLYEALKLSNVGDTIQNKVSNIVIDTYEQVYNLQQDMLLSDDWELLVENKSLNKEYEMLKKQVLSVNQKIQRKWNKGV